VEGRLPNMSVEAPKNITDPRTGKKLAGYVLRAAALVPRGFYDENDIAPVRFESVENELHQAADVPPLTNQVTMETTLSGAYIAMLAAGLANNNKKETEPKEMEAILKLLGLEADATEAQVLEAIKTLQDSQTDGVELQEQVEAAEEATGVQLAAIPDAWLAVKSDDKAQEVAMLTERVNTLGEDLTKAKEEGQTAKEELHAIQLGAFIEDGQAAGKIGTVEDEDGNNADIAFWTEAYKMDAEKAATMLSTAPIRFEVGKLTGLGATDKEPGTDTDHGNRVAMLAVDIQGEEPGMDIQTATAKAEARLMKEKQEAGQGSQED